MAINVAVTLRSLLTRALTWAELDNNFTDIKAALAGAASDDDLASAAAGKGASQVGVQDAAGNFPNITSPKQLEAIAALYGSLEYRRNVVAYSHLAVGTNWAPAWQACHDFIEGLAQGGVMTFPPNFSKRFDTGIYWNPGKVKVDGNGALVDFGYVPGNGVYCIQLRQTIMDANLRHAANRAHPWTNTEFSGSYGNTQMTWLLAGDYNPISGEYHAAGLTFRDCAVMNFWRDIMLGNGGFFLNFDNVSFNILGLASGGSYDSSFYAQAGLSNAGENIRFSGCAFLKVYGTAITCGMPASSLFFKGCSCDYTDVIAYIDSGTHFDWDGYIESNKDVAQWIKVYGANSLAWIRGAMFVTGNKTAYEIFLSDAAATNGGVVANINMQFGGGITYEPLKLVAGQGRAVIKLLSHSNSTTHPALGGSTNTFANPSFESAALTDLVLTGASLPARSNTYAHTGSWSLRFAASSGVSPSATKTLPAKPGDFSTGELYYRVDAITGTSGHFYIQIDWLDAGGTSIGGGAVVDATTNVGSWTRARLAFLAPAPAGTAFLRLSVSIFGVASGSPMGYIDDVDFAVA